MSKKSKTKFVVLETQTKHNWWSDGPSIDSYIYGVYDSRQEAVRGAKDCCEIAMSDYNFDERVEVTTSLVLDRPDHKVIMEVSGKKLGNGESHYSSSMTTIRIIER